MKLLTSLLLFCCALVGSQSAAAHAIGLSRGDYSLSDDGVTATLEFAHTELASAIAGVDSDGDGRISAPELLQHRLLVDQAIRDGVKLSASAATCASTVSSAELTDNDGLRVVQVFRCAVGTDGYSLQFALLDRLSPGHRHLATAVQRGAPITSVLYQASPSVLLSGPHRHASGSVGWPLVKLGVEHILTGYDHLVFLFGLLIVARGWRDLLLVVTAFTLGHSITLGIATLGIWMPSSSVIEPLIALSIVYVGVENWFVRDDARRWPLTLAFGLVHGFGFAGVLSEIALPSAQLPLALLSFNGGVELGQLLILCVALPAVFWLRRRAWFARQGVRALSAAIALAGLGWFIERVL